MKGNFRRSVTARLILYVAAIPSACSSQTPPEIKLTSHVVRLKGKRPFPLLLPGQFTISPAAEGLQRVRFRAKSHDGRIFVTTSGARAAVRYFEAERKFFLVSDDSANVIYYVRAK
jgi:hypothetical protein